MAVFIIKSSVVPSKKETSTGLLVIGTENQSVIGSMGLTLENISSRLLFAFAYKYDMFYAGGYLSQIHFLT
jgi:hypothetical protein